MAPTNRTPAQVAVDALLDTVLPEPGEGLATVAARNMTEALSAEGWIRTPAERFERLLPDPPMFRTYSLVEVRNGTGWAAGVRFLPIPPLQESVDNPVDPGDNQRGIR